MADDHATVVVFDIDQELALLEKELTEALADVRRRRSIREGEHSMSTDTVTMTRDEYDNIVNATGELRGSIADLRESVLTLATIVVAQRGSAAGAAEVIRNLEGDDLK